MSSSSCKPSSRQCRQSSHSFWSCSFAYYSCYLVFGYWVCRVPAAARGRSSTPTPSCPQTHRLLLQQQAPPRRTTTFLPELLIPSCCHQQQQLQVVPACRSRLQELAIQVWRSLLIPKMIIPAAAAVLLLMMFCRVIPDR